ncbi:MAG: hypothetical protein KF760_13655 [Candidatus Eremiobacteraeota bacterium]|nr:hypothetical protein [Candidatus Eremiobacteraeota bacterium]MCW5867786.1 hypothetical protein [Candidatus Eremiobacteraeota bacterium]
MELAMGDWDETAEARHRERAEKAARRQESCESKLRLEQFAHPEDLYDEVDPQDAYHDLQVSLYRQLARQSKLPAGRPDLLD